jgi:hypothetical protein
MPSNSTDPDPARLDAAPPRAGSEKHGSLWLNLLFSGLATGVLFLLIEGLASALMSARAAKRVIFLAKLLPGFSGCGPDGTARARGWILESHDHRVKAADSDRMNSLPVYWACGAYRRSRPR